MKTFHPKSTTDEGEPVPPRWIRQVGLTWLYRIIVRWLGSHQDSADR